MIDLLRQSRAIISFQEELAGPWLPREEEVRQAAVHFPSLMSTGSGTDDFARQHESGEERSPFERIADLIPAGHPLREMNTLHEIGEWLASAILTPIDEQRTNPVLGVGDPDADLMVIGEAPGADEDLQGEPFVGKAGQLLNKILEAVDFKREEVYIANILKSRPPNNRDPRPDEVEAHIPILYRQIALVRPRIILAVGKQAGCGLLGQVASLASMRGKLQDFHGLPVVVTYHPAALLRNPQWKRPTWEDVQFLRQHYDQLRASSA